jgi:hypothetical protein
VHYFLKGETATPGKGCGKGSAAKPEAEPGNLCVYTGEAEPTIKAENVEFNPPAFPREVGAGATGAVLKIFVEQGSAGYAVGTWAVTAK